MGRLLQVSTGEGKSIIVRLVAAYHALKGRKVNVITSKNELAQRDAADARDFLSELGLTVAYLPAHFDDGLSKDKQRLKALHESDVVYSTVHNFCVADLRRYMPGPVQHVRPMDFLIVDEVDSMLIDKSEISTYISEPSYYRLSGIFSEIWQQLTSILQNENLGSTFSDKRRREMKSSIKKHMERIIGEQKEEKLRRLAESKLDKWVELGIRAVEMQENEHYVVVDNKVKIVDQDTGETQGSMRWANGLHYFIERKHAILGEGFSSATLFENHMTHIRKYEDLVGLSGTLGSRVCRGFLEEHYSLDMFKMPTFCPKLYEKMPPALCENKERWESELLGEVDHFGKTLRRPLLIIFKTIKKAEEFYAILKKKKYEARRYLKSFEKKETGFFELDKGSIILATNFGGRGTDFRVSEKCSERGGLHVVVTFTAPNSRVERQAFGRTARRGQRGSGRMILNVQENPWLSELVSGLANSRLTTASARTKMPSSRSSRHSEISARSWCSRGTRETSWRG